MKTVWGFLTAVILLAGLSLPLATAQTPVPIHKFNETNMHAPPEIKIFDYEMQNWPLGWVNANGWCGTDNPVVISTDTGNVTLSIWVGLPRFADPLYPAMPAPGNTFSNGYLTSISYQASWQTNQTRQIYTNTSKNHPNEFHFNLTNVPYGYQTIHVYATCVITPYDCATASTYDIPQSSEKLLNFTVAAPPTPTPKEQNIAPPSTAYIAALIIIAVVSFVTLTVLNKKRHRDSK